MSKSEIKKLAMCLELARTAYYETAEPVMTDAEFDELVEKLRALDPSNKFFDQPGPTPQKGKELLPVPMASLKKIKPDTWSSWLGYSAKGFVLSEKLDGISALWCTGTRQLYLRGDGKIGQNVSFAVPHIQGLVSKIGHWIVRGELIMPSSQVQGTLARNIVNGYLHRDDDVSNLKKVQFVAYQVLEPSKLTRSQQFTWLHNQGFITAWNTTCAELTLETLSAAFKDRRSNSTYTCDGIVVGTDTIPEPPSINEPNDAVAYKEVADDQMKTTKVIKVDWQASRLGLWVPRLQVEPVVIGSATIQYCTAFNAKYISDNKLGEGATIKLRRSGDVIPTIDSVLSSTKADMPPDGEWEWDSTKVNALVKDKNKNLSVLAKGLVHSCTVFGVEGFKDASAMTLCEAGITSVADCLKATKSDLQKILGLVNGAKLHTSLLAKMKEASPDTWIIAAPCWSRGFGKTKLSAVYDVEPDITKWSTLNKSIKGIGPDSLKQIQETAAECIAWKTSIDKIIGTNNVVVHINKPKNVVKGLVCMSGFRDADMQAKLEAHGFAVSDSVNKNTVALFVADITKKTTKTETALKNQVPIYGRDKLALFLETQKN